jgi:hypothetical protein
MYHPLTYPYPIFDYVRFCAIIRRIPTWPHTLNILSELVMSILCRMWDLLWLALPRYACAMKSSEIRYCLQKTRLLRWPQNWLVPPPKGICPRKLRWWLIVFVRGHLSRLLKTVPGIWMGKWRNVPHSYVNCLNSKCNLFFFMWAVQVWIFA